MNRVLYALIPITFFSVFLFGWRVIAVLTVANLCAFLTEYLFIRNRKGGKVSMAVFVTGSLLALSLPPTIPLWIAAVGAVVAVAFGKMVFGGFGMNVFNPAIVGRIFIYISFPNAMTVRWLTPFSRFPGGFSVWQNKTLLTAATPMIELKKNGIIPDFTDIFTGLIPGSMGETSAILILLAALFLIITKTAKWQAMLSTFISFNIFAIIFYQQLPFTYLFSGAILFGIVFMVTDPVSMPKNKTAVWIYGALIGMLTVFIRKLSLFTGAFGFAVLITNTFMPIIEFGLNKRKAGRS
ncbi:RnfABCDGE type electron transport complex subunit D [Candidatus Cloacimonadota bacterium]